MRKEGVKIGALWEAPLKECPVKEDPTVVEIMEEQEAQGVISGPIGGRRPRGKGDKWDPKALSPKMDHMMSVQLFNPTVTADQLAKLVNLSTSQVRHILGSGMYRTKYRMRRVDIEKLQNSRVAAERAKFELLRDEMVEAHRRIMDIDKTAHVGKELELEKLKQRSVSDLLRMSTEQLKEIDRKLDGPGNGEGTIGAEVELDTSDPKKAYVRLLGTFRKGTK